VISSFRSRRSFEQIELSEGVAPRAVGTPACRNPTGSPRGVQPDFRLKKPLASRAEERPWHQLIESLRLHHTA
jgi:hypothetical protein